MSAPAFKVFDAQGRYRAACKEIDAAACLMGFYGDGASIRLGHAKADTVWLEGAGGLRAQDSHAYVRGFAAAKWRVRSRKVLERMGRSPAEIAAIMDGDAT